MVAADDSWYIRFPDGRVTRAANTTVVRQNIVQHHLPPTCMVRRNGDDDWKPLERTREFADLLEANTAEAPTPRRVREEVTTDRPANTVGVGSRLDTQRLDSVGVRPVLQEMLAALDASLTRRKLITAALLMAACGGVVLATQALLALAPDAEYFIWALSALLFLLISSTGLGLIAKLTYVELQRMRPAHWKDGRSGLAGLTWRLLLANLVVGIVVVGVPIDLVLLSRWLLSPSAAAWDALAQATGVLTILTAACLAPLGVAALLLGPILVFENGSAFTALRMWVGLLRRHFGRIVLNEAAAVTIGALLSVPFLLPVMATAAFRLEDRLAVVVRNTRIMLTCLALTPALAFLAVANVFLFVNLRYDTGNRRDAN